MRTAFERFEKAEVEVESLERDLMFAARRLTDYAQETSDTKLIELAITFHQAAAAHGEAMATLMECIADVIDPKVP